MDKNFFSIVQKYEYDVKLSRTRTFVGGQRRTKVRPCGRPFILLYGSSSSKIFILLYVVII